jgi:hypothetical protein
LCREGKYLKAKPIKKLYYSRITKKNNVLFIRRLWPSTLVMSLLIED